MDTTATPSAPSPVDSTERARILDVIRGFALGGVFLSNVYVWMSGLIFMSRDAAKEAMSGTAQKVVDIVFSIFIGGKFMTIFTFLFGLGLAIQFSRAEERNDSPTKRYLRRCFAFLLLGFLHMFFIWYGDITHQYAIVGLFVLLFRKRSTKTLLIWGLAITLLAVPMGMWIQFTLPKYLYGAEAAQAMEAAKQAKDEAFGRQALAVYGGDSYLEIIKMNFKSYTQHFTGPIYVAYNFGNLGNFLLGVAIGRLGWFQDVAAHKKAFKHLLGWNALIAVVSFATSALIHHFVGKDKGPPADVHVAFTIIMPVMRNLMTLSLALVYVAAIVLLFQRPFFQRVFSIYGPVGRMAMTNYYLQSVIGVFVFYGIGLGHLTDIRPRWIVVMPVVMFTVQMLFSWLWLRHFRFGPVEWISRSLTYGKLQPMRYSQETSREVST